MDPIKNPFSPGAGSPPPELVGRSPILEQARILFGRVKARRSEKSLLLTGLRGVGKTVLLNEIERLAVAEDYLVASIEARENKALGPLLIPHLKRLLLELDRLAGVSDKVKRGLRVLKSFFGLIKLQYHDVTFGLDIDPEKGTADSGDLEADLTALFVALGEAAEDRRKAVAVIVDEIQYISSIELGSLVMAMHEVQQRQLPLVLVGGGLPILPGLAGESKSYAERLFSFPDVGPLLSDDAKRALREPARKLGVIFDEEALDDIFEVTQGYPYFVQEWGYQCWNQAERSPITRSLVKEAGENVTRRLDENFFRVRFERLIPSERRFLRAMAELGPKPQRTGDIAELLGLKVQSLGPCRAKLIKKGMIYSPAHGDLAFTVPMFDKFMIRAVPDLETKR